MLLTSVPGTTMIPVVVATNFFFKNVIELPTSPNADQLSVNCSWQHGKNFLWKKSELPQ